MLGISTIEVILIIVLVMSGISMLFTFLLFRERDFLFHHFGKHYEDEVAEFKEKTTQAINQLDQDRALIFHEIKEETLKEIEKFKNEAVKIREEALKEIEKNILKLNNEDKFIEIADAVRVILDTQSDYLKRLHHLDQLVKGRDKRAERKDKQLKEKDMQIEEKDRQIKELKEKTNGI